MTSLSLRSLLLRDLFSLYSFTLQKILVSESPNSGNDKVAVNELNQGREIVMPLDTLKVALQPEMSPSVTDGQLIEKFIEEHDSTAFTELVRRHGAMVFGTCRRILRHHQDAEDAFQAVFLVLAHKADSISPPEKLAGWLHGVACRTALKSRSIIQKRQASETLSGDVVCACSPSNPEDLEWLAILDEELEQLPEKYRIPIVLCGLQGKSRQSVAQLLGCPEGTVAGRYYRARQLLAQRLSRRGIVLSLAAISTAFSHQAAASVPVSLAASTIRPAILLRLGSGGAETIPVPVHTLSQGVLQAMASSQWKSAAVWLCAILFTVSLGYLGTAFASGGTNGSATSPRTNKQPDREPIDPELVLQKGIQKELRLSNNQIQKLQTAWEEGKANAKGEQKAKDELSTQIVELEKKLKELKKKQASLQASIRQKQQGSLKQAIFAQLSNRAINRLRQITLRKRDLRSLLEDPKWQAKLNINDEQLKKLQESHSLSANVTVAGIDYYRLIPTRVNNLVISWDIDNEAVLKILTPEQRQIWKEMIGEPYPRPKEK